MYSAYVCLYVKNHYPNEISTHDGNDGACDAEEGGMM